ncbi:hypothetical protein GGF32_008706 [Allomyces javanicus]|nr:hypothetical protein GGF32_008706 [Allomyces javanicus]
MDSTTNDPPADPSTMADDPTSPATTAPGPVSAADEQRLASLRDARRANLAALTQRVAPGRGTNLDANMKKNMTFFKKLRLVTADNVATLLAELAKLKVDKYLAEITSALLENFTSGRKLPVADLDAILAITCQLHRRFTAHFTPGLVDALIGACALKPGGGTNASGSAATTATAPAAAVSDATLEKAERERLAKNKPLLRVLTDLYLVGLLQPMAGNTIPDSLGDGSSTPATIVAKPRGRDARAPQDVADDRFLALIQELLVDRTHANLPLLATLVRFYAPVLFTEPGDPPPGHTPDPAETLAPPVIQTKLSKAVNKYFDQLVKRLTSDQRALAKLQHKAREWAFERGTEAPEDMRQRLDRDQRVFETLSTQAQILATHLDRQLPVFDAKGDEDAEQASGTSITLHKMERKLDSGLWDDDEDRAFYQDLPELELMLPPTLLQTAKTLKAAAAAVAAAGLSMPARAADDGEDAADQAGDVAAAAFTAPATIDDRPPASLETLEDEDDADQGKSRLDAEDDDANGDDEEEEDSSSASQLTALLSRLPHCDNPALIDQAAVEFCYYNTRKAQRRLARVLVDVRQRGDMVALYARLLAILKRFEIADLVIDELDRTFRRQIRTTRQLAGPAAMDAFNAKLVSARYLSELVKFRLAPAPVVFFNLKLLLENVTPSNVETLSHFLEGCGRFLLADPATNARMVEVLEWVTRIKKRLTDTRLVLMVESAQAACQPRTPGSGAIKKKERPPEEEYILYLFTELTKPRVKYTIMQLRKFAWAEEATMDLMVKRFSKLKGVKFHQLEHVAAVLVGLCVYHPDLGIYVVDNLIEYIKSAMERNNYQENQMRTMKTAFLGHLYNAFVVDGNLIFAVLELLISFPFKDGPTEFFRIRLVAALLDVCGARLNKVRLDRFLIMFQLYIVCKNPLPMDVEFVVQDLFETLRPKMKRMSYDEAVEAAQELVGKQAKQQGTVTSPTAADADAADIEGAEPDLTGEGSGEPELSDAGSDGLGESDDEDEDEDDDDESDLSDSDDDDDDLDDDLSDLSDLDDLEDDEDDEDEEEADEEEDESAMLDRELQMLMSERPDPSSRRRPVAVTAIAIPDRHAAATRAVPGAAANMSSSAEPSLALLTKRGAKVVTREFTVPEDSELAQHVAQIRAREEAERLELKSYVLKYERRELEERAAEVAAAAANAGGRQGGKRVLWSNSGTRGRT